MQHTADNKGWLYSSNKQNNILAWRCQKRNQKHIKLKHWTTPAWTWYSSLKSNHNLESQV